MAATSQGFVHDAPGPGSLTAKTIWQELDAAGVSWKIYSADTNFFSFLQDFAFFNQPGVAAHVVPVAQYFADASAGKLPGVSFIEAGLHDGLSEHSSNFDPANPQLGEVPINVQVGAQWASTVINALMLGPSWSDSVLFFAHDEGGGTFDHVSPIGVPNPDGIQPKDLRPNDVPGDFTLTGSRVPNMVVSPFAKKNFVSHTPMDYTSYLRFIEARFSLPTLTARDAAMPDMTEFFDFTGKPWATPPTPPAQNMNGACDYSRQATGVYGFAYDNMGRLNRAAPRKYASNRHPMQRLMNICVASWIGRRVCWPLVDKGIGKPLSDTLKLRSSATYLFQELFLLSAG